MKVIQPFFLGGACGLALALALSVGMYVSPLRKGLYLDLDPEIADVKGRLGGIAEIMRQADMGIAEISPAGGSADSLKKVQAGAWKEYRHWRGRLGELSRLHDRATPADFWPFAYSLRYWMLPGGALLALLPALLWGWRASRFSSPRARSARPSGRSGAAQAAAPGPAAGSRPATAASTAALSTFESAVKQVARIAAPDQAAREERPAQKEKKTEYLPEVPGAGQQAWAGNPESPPSEDSPYEAAGSDLDEPGTRDLQALEDEAQPTGRETQFIELGPGWGEPVPGVDGTPRHGSLSMEDEDGSEAAGEEPPTGTFMPPTTEVEKVERRKAEVVKLARKGLTSSEISKRLRISQDQVEFIIRLRREKG